MRKKRILIVVGNNLMHGTERYALDLAKNLNNDLFDVTIATPETGPLSDILKENHIKEFVYCNGKFNSFSIRGIFNFIRFLLKNKFDVIHSNFSIIPNIIGRLLGVKLNIEIKHGILIPDENLFNLTFRQKFHEKLKEYFVDFFIAISNNDKEKMIKYFDISPNKIEIVYNGLDIEKIEKFRNNGKGMFRENNSILIGTVGRFTYQKAQNVLIEAFEKALPYCSDAKLMIIGTGEDKEDIKRIIEKKKLESKIVIENYKVNIFDYINSFDIFILTSRFEGVPYVLLESMALGTPIISTKVGGIDNVLKCSETALLTEKDNIGDITNAIIRLVNDSNLREKLAQNAIIEIKKYDVRKMAKNVSNLYLKYLS